MSPADRAALLERAAFQELHYDERASRAYQREVLATACAELGVDTAAARRLGSSRNADLYRIDARDGRWLLKILVSKPARTLEHEYAQLEALYGLSGESGLFRVPPPRRLFASRSAYLMGFVEGRTLAARMLEGAGPRQLEAASAGCGRALAAIHRAWAAPPSPCDGAALRRDFEHLPWRPGRAEAVLLDRAVARLDGRTLPAARLYLDFDPVNVLLPDDGPPVLLDPPERLAVDAPQWDLGIFLFGLRRVAWRRPHRASRIGAAAEGMRRAFVQGYSGASAPPGGGDGELIVGLAELARVGQLWRWWLEPLGFRHRLTGLARAIYARPLLRSARERAYGELERALARRDG